jgi:hypothetical protein
MRTNNKHKYIARVARASTTLDQFITNKLKPNKDETKTGITRG